MKLQELIISCRYSDEKTNIPQSIQGCFDDFLRKELQNVAKCLYSSV